MKVKVKVKVLGCSGCSSDNGYRKLVVGNPLELPR